MPVLADRILDNGLGAFNAEATHVDLCSSEPATYTAATSTANLGTKNQGAGTCVGAPAAGSPNGRKATIAAVVAGSVTANGTATHAAITDHTNSRLLATLALSASQAVVSGNTWGTPAVDVRIPNQ